MSARAPAAARDGRRARLRGRDGGGYFPGNSSRGRLTRRSLRIGRTLLVSISLARSLVRSPVAARNSVDVIRQQFQQHSRHIAGSRVAMQGVCVSAMLRRDAVYKWRPRVASLHRSADLYSCLLPPPPARSLLLSLSLFLSISLFPHPRALYALIGLRSLRLNITEFCRLYSRARARTTTNACQRGRVMKTEGCLRETSCRREVGLAEGLSRKNRG